MINKITSKDLSSYDIFKDDKIKKEHYNQNSNNKNKTYENREDGRMKTNRKVTYAIQECLGILAARCASCNA